MEPLCCNTCLRLFLLPPRLLPPVHLIIILLLSSLEKTVKPSICICACTRGGYLRRPLNKHFFLFCVFARFGVFAFICPCLKAGVLCLSPCWAHVVYPKVTFTPFDDSRHVGVLRNHPCETHSIRTHTHTNSDSHSTCSHIPAINLLTRVWNKKWCQYVQPLGTTF